MSAVCEHVTFDAATALFAMPPIPAGAHRMECPCCHGQGWLNDDDPGPLYCPDCLVPAFPKVEEPVPDHPHSDPGDGRSECEACGKWVWPCTHSCKGVPVTEAAKQRYRDKPVTG